MQEINREILKKKTIVDLRVIAKHLGIKRVDTYKKGDLIELLLNETGVDTMIGNKEEEKEQMPDPTENKISEKNNDNADNKASVIVADNSNEELQELESKPRKKRERIPPTVIKPLSSNRNNPDTSSNRVEKSEFKPKDTDKETQEVAEQTEASSTNESASNDVKISKPKATTTSSDDTKAASAPVKSVARDEYFGVVKSVGVLEVLSDGYGFLRSSDYNYLNSTDTKLRIKAR